MGTPGSLIIKFAQTLPPLLAVSSTWWWLCHSAEYDTFVVQRDTTTDYLIRSETDIHIILLYLLPKWSWVVCRLKDDNDPVSGDY